MFKQAIFLSFLNTGGRILNFVVYLIIVNNFGANKLTDWFFFVYAIVYFIITTLIRSVENVFVPVFNKYGEKSVPLLFRKVISISGLGTILIVTLIAAIGFSISPYLGIPHPGHFPLAIGVIVLLSLQPGLALISTFFSSFLQLQRQYILPTINLSLRAVGILPFLFIPSLRNIIGLSCAYLVGETFRLIVLARSTLSEILMIGHKSEISSFEISSSKVFIHIGWMSFALATSSLNPIIDLAMVGNISSGAATLVEYAGRLRGMPILALGGITTLLLGEWSHRHYNENEGLTYSQISKAFLMVFSFSALLVAIVFLSMGYWLPLIFFSSKFTTENLVDLNQLFNWYLPGVPMLAGYVVLSRALLVLRKTRILAGIALLVVVLNIIFNFVFIKIMGLQGVALSTSCIDLAACLAALFIIRLTFVSRNVSTG